MEYFNYQKFIDDVDTINELCINNSVVQALRLGENLDPANYTIFNEETGEVSTIDISKIIGYAVECTKFYAAFVASGCNLDVLEADVLLRNLGDELMKNPEVKFWTNPEREVD